MVSYNLQGTYLYEGYEFTQVGIFTRNPRGKTRRGLLPIMGFIADGGSSNPRHNLEGEIVFSKEGAILTFTKSSRNMSIGIKYNLKKKSKGIEGTYLGSWNHTEQGAHVEIGFVSGEGARAMVREAESENKAYLEIKKFRGISRIEQED